MKIKACQNFQELCDRIEKVMDDAIESKDSMQIQAANESMSEILRFEMVRLLFDIKKLLEERK